MPPSEGSCIKDIAMESILLAALRNSGIPGILDVYVHPMSCQSRTVVRIRPQFPSHAKAVFCRMLGSVSKPGKGGDRCRRRLRYL